MSESQRMPDNWVVVCHTCEKRVDWFFKTYTPNGMKSNICINCIREALETSELDDEQD